MQNLEHLNVFISVAELGSFSAAARFLGKGTTTVAVMMGKLEDHLGFTLFDRSAGKATLTAKGERLYGLSQQVCWQATRLEDSISRMSSYGLSTLTIGIDGMIPISLVFPFLDSLEGSDKNIRVSIIRAPAIRLLSKLESGAIDAAIIVGDAFSHSGAEFFHIANIELSTICSPESPLLELESISLESLTLSRQIMTEDQTSNVFLSSHFTVSRDIWTVERCDEQIHLVEQDLGWAVLPDQLAKPYIEAGSVVEFVNEVECVPSNIPIELRILPNFKRSPQMSSLIHSLCSPQELNPNTLKDSQ